MRAVGKLTAIAIASLVVLVAPLAGADSKTVGKNPGKTKGRWLRVDDVGQLKSFEKVCIGEITSDIQWKKEGKESPIDEKLLNDKTKEYLLQDLRASGLFSQTQDGCPQGDPGVLRLDVEILVDPGNRAVRYFAGFGAGKSKSITEIHLRDNGSGGELGLYHGYGTGSGMGFKVGGGGARKMTEDDVQENSKMFVELMQQVL